MKHILGTTLISLILASGAGANLHHVPDDFTTIQGALDLVAAGDTITVRDGLWTGESNRNLDFGGKDLVLRSESGPDHCTLDAEGTGDWDGNQRHLYFHSGETRAAIVTGFRFIGGYVSDKGEFGKYGGAIFCESGSSPTIRNCVFEGNTGYRGGGVAGISGAAPRLDDCIFLNNQGSMVQETHNDNGGGGAYFREAGEVQVTGCTFTGNAGCNGGGFHYWEGDGLTVHDSLFEENEAEVAGGLLVWYSPFHLENTDFLENEAYWLTGQGGGLWVTGCDDVVVTGCEFRGNRANYAGGLSIGNCDRETLDNCLIIGNEARMLGGGLRWSAMTGQMNDCIISGNTADEGGGLTLEDGSRVRVEHGIVQGDSNQVFLGDTGEGEYIWGEYNLAVDPQFCTNRYDLDQWWAVQSDSPCLSPTGRIGAVGSECDETPNWLNGYTARAEPGGVRIEWSLSAPAGDPVFRLSAEREVAIPVHGGNQGILAASPNPFNPGTTISFVTRQPGVYTLSIYDVRGNAITTLVEGGLAPGDHHARWDGRDQEGRPTPSGIYFARLVGESTTSRRRLVLLR